MSYPTLPSNPQVSVANAMSPSDPPKIVQVEQVRIDRAIQELKSLTKGEPISALNILQFCLDLMRIVEVQPDLVGEQKKTVVLQAISQVLKEQGGDLSILALVPTFIDQAISLDKGEIQIAQPQEMALACCSLLAGCLATQNAKTVKKKLQKTSK